MSNEITPTVAHEALPPFSQEPKPETVSAIVLDDDEDLAELTATFLEREEHLFTARATTEQSEVIDAATEGNIDAIVSDYQMPDQDGLEVLKEVRDSAPDIPFILFTAEGSEDVAAEAISSGVTDYLQKRRDSSQYSLLANRLLNAVKQTKAKEALVESEEWFSTMVEASTDLMCIIDTSGTFVYLSPASSRVLGYEPQELVGESVFEFAHPDDRRTTVEEFYEAIEEPGYQSVVEFRFDHPNGHWPVIEARGRNLVDDDTINGFVVNSRDITDLRESQQTLAQRNEELEELYSTLRQDIVSTAEVAEGALELYQEDGDEAALARLQNSLADLQATAEDLALRSDGKEDGPATTEPVHFAEVADEVWDEIKTGGARLTIPSSHRIRADPSQLSAMFKYLIRDSVSASEESSGLEITIQSVDDGLVYSDTRTGVADGGTISTDVDLRENPLHRIVATHDWDLEVTTQTGSEGPGARVEITGIDFVPLVRN